MPRFNPKRFDALAESRPGSQDVDTREVHSRTGGIVLGVQPGECGCGCGQTPSGRGSEFMQGHDIRLRGALARAAYMRVPVTLVVDGREHTSPAAGIARHHGWGRQVANSVAGYKARFGETQATTLGEPRKVKVGRWVYEGTVVAVRDHSETVQYETRKGETRKVEVAR